MAHLQTVARTELLHSVFLCIGTFRSCETLSQGQSWCHTGPAIVVTLLSLPPVVFSSGDCNPVGASICCFVYSIISLKLVSYHMVNYWCRQNPQRNRTRHNSFDDKSNGKVANGHTNGHANGDIAHYSPVLVTYPNNLTIGDLAYFIAAPTLCYELNFPRTDRIRKRFLLRRVFEIVS